MSISIKLAWRNMFRNKRRTIIAGIAIGVGLAALIVVDALVIGMEKNMITSVTSSFLGEGQIHYKGFRQTHEIEQTINNLDNVLAELQKESTVERFTERIMTFAMITSPANVSAVSMFGINPETERYLSEIDDVVIEGAYFDGNDNHDLIIGNKLAEILEVELGDRVVLTAAQAGSGDLSQEMFRISGIYYFNVNELDRGMAFVRIKKAREMLGLEGQAHEIAIKFIDMDLARDEKLPFWQKYSTDGNEAVGWTMILPQLYAVFEMSQFATYIVGLILFGVIALGIINTLFMSLHERMFEFGVLRAVGTRPFDVGKLIIFEAGSLAAISIILGIVLGYLVTWIFMQTGIDYRGIEYAGATFRDLLYPVMTLNQFIKYPIWVFVFTALVALYPASFAAKMKPAEAMRKSF